MKTEPTTNESRVTNGDSPGLRGLDQTQITLHKMYELAHNIMLRRSELFASSLDGKHNLKQDCGYPTEISTEQFDEIYRREGIGARVVKLMPEECWKEDPEVLETQDTDEETEFEKEWKRLEKKHKIYTKLERLDKLSGIGQYGVMLIGLDDGKSLDQPVAGVREDPDDAEIDDVLPVAGDAPRRLLYLRVFGQKYVTIDKYETNDKSPRFGQPVMYSISFAEVEGRQTTSNKKVHWTRIIHVADEVESDETLGQSRMKDVFNRLFDLRKICGGSGEMFWRGGFPGINFKMDPPGKGTRALTDSERDALKEEVEQYMRGLQRYIATEGMSVSSISPSVASPLDHFEMNLKAIAIAKGCPYRVFTGTEEAKLAGGQDTRAWNGRVARRRDKHVTPYIIEALVVRLGEMGVLILPKEWFVVWQDLNTQTDTEKADNAQKLAAAIAAYVNASSDTLVPPEEFLAHILKLPDDIVDQIMKASEEWVRNMETKIEDDAAKEEKQMKMDHELQKATIKQKAAKPPPKAKAKAKK